MSVVGFVATMVLEAYNSESNNAPVIYKGYMKMFASGSGGLGESDAITEGAGGRYCAWNDSCCIPLLSDETALPNYLGMHLGNGAADSTA